MYGIMDEFANSCFVTDPAGSVTLMDAYLAFKSWYRSRTANWMLGHQPPRKVFKIWMEQNYPSLDNGQRFTGVRTVLFN